MESGGYHYKFDEAETTDYRKSKQNKRQPLPRRRRVVVTKVRKKWPRARKNRPHAHIEQVSLQCCVARTCLLNLGRAAISTMRTAFDRMLYKAQNEHLSSKMEVAFAEGDGKRNVVKYRVTDRSRRRVEICRTAFAKIYGVGCKRIKTLLKKVQPYTGCIQEDQRLLCRNQRKLPTALKAEVRIELWTVIDFMCKQFLFVIIKICIVLLER